MIRYIIKHSYKYKYNGCEGNDLFTIDGDAEQVENLLMKGGFDEDSYDRYELVGVEIIK